MCSKYKMDTRIVIYVQFPEGTDLAAPDGGRFDFVKTPPFSLEETFSSFFHTFSKILRISPSTSRGVHKPKYFGSRRFFIATASKTSENNITVI